jgi:zinc transport system substrate-binding protein
MGIVLDRDRSAARSGPWLRARSVVTVAVALLAGGCAGGSEPDDGRPDVVAAFYPLAYAAERVGGGLVDVENLTPPGVEPHDLELAPQQIADVQGADVVLYLGGAAPAVDRTVDGAEGVVADLLPASAEGGDVHVWLDPVRYAGMVDRVADAFAEADPSEAEAFRREADAFTDELSILDEEFRDGLGGCERDLVVTSHDAFGYLGERYGLRVESIAGLAPDAEPSPERLADLASLVQREGVTTIFTEELVSPKVAEALAREVGVGTAVLDPLEGLTEEVVAAGDDYLTVMRRNLAALQEALGCP